MLLVVLLAVSAFALALAIVQPRWACYVAIFFVPWVGLDVDAGLRVTAYRIFSTALIVGVLLRSARTSRSEWPGPFRWLSYFVGWSLLVSAVHVPFLSEVAGFQGMRTPTLRALTQIVIFLIQCAPAVIIPLLFDRERDVVRIFRVYVVSVGALCVLGWVQVILWYKTGENILPIGLVGRTLGRESILMGGYDPIAQYGVTVLRMSSLGGEPRNLASSIVLALAVLQGLAMHRRHLSALVLALWVFLFASLVMTLSTSGFYTWALGSAALLASALWLRVGRGPRRPGFSLVRGVVPLATAAVVVAIGASYVTKISAGTRLTSVDDILETRVLREDVRGQRMVLEDFDTPVLNLLRNEPEFALVGTGLGNAHLHARRYVPYDAWFAAIEGHVLVAKVGALKVCSEGGLVALALLLGWVLSCARLLRGLAVRQADPSMAAVYEVMALVWIPFALLFLAQTQMMESFFLAGGCAGALLVMGTQRERSAALLRQARLTQRLHALHTPAVAPPTP